MADAAAIFSLYYLPYSNALPEFLYSLYSTKHFEVTHPISLLSVKPLTSDFNMFSSCSLPGQVPDITVPSAQWIPCYAIKYPLGPSFSVSTATTPTKLTASYSSSTTVGLATQAQCLYFLSGHVTTTCLPTNWPTASHRHHWPAPVQGQPNKPPSAPEK